MFACACPIRLSANSVQNLIQQLSEIYVQLGSGKHWDATQSIGNPAQIIPQGHKRRASESASIAEAS